MTSETQRGTSYTSPYLILIKIQRASCYYANSTDLETEAQSKGSKAQVPVLLSWVRTCKWVRGTVGWIPFLKWAIASWLPMSLTLWKVRVSFFKRSCKSNLFYKCEISELKKKRDCFRVSIREPVAAGTSYMPLYILITFLARRNSNPILSKCYWLIWYNTLSLCARPNVFFVEDVSYNS